METITLKKENVIAAYKDADKKEKTLLEKLFGEDLKPKKITDRVKTFEDACERLGIKYDEMCGLTTDETAYRKLKIICRALNQGWTPDWSNANEYKWYPWFKFKAGFGFSYPYPGYDGTVSVVGSRLCFKTEELAAYAGKQFEAIYNDFLTLNQ